MNKFRNSFGHILFLTLYIFKDYGKRFIFLKSLIKSESIVLKNQMQSPSMHFVDFTIQAFYYETSKEEGNSWSEIPKRQYNQAQGPQFV